jgi:GNL3L/Grn1 putative GTPase
MCITVFHGPETSKRATTAHRARVKHKVAESRKKSKKAAKKDSTWKSSACSYVCFILHPNNTFLS